MNKNKGSVLILTLLIMTTSTVITMAYLSMVRYDTLLVDSQENGVHALYIAEAGLNKAVWYLLNTAPDSTADGLWRTTAYPSAAGGGPYDPQQESFEGGTYTLWVEDAGGPILITASGVYNGIARVVHQRVSLVYTPNALKKIVFAGGDIDLDNATGTLSGAMASRGQVIASSGVTVSGGYSEYTDINFPTVDLANYQAIADTVVSGDQTFSSGAYSGVWYIDGNVSISSNVSFTGSIVATGNIDFTGQTDITITPAGTNPALLTSGNILADGSFSIYLTGLVYAANDIQINSVSDFVLSGAFLAGGRVSAQSASNLSLSYDTQIFSSPTPYLTDGNTSKTLTSITGSWGIN